MKNSSNLSDSMEYQNIVTYGHDTKTFPLSQQLPNTVNSLILEKAIAEESDKTNVFF